YLLYLILEFCPIPLTVVDAACAATRCCSTFLCSQSKNVANVISCVDADCAPDLASSLRGLLAELAETDRTGTGPLLSIVESARPWEIPSIQQGATRKPSLILLDPAMICGSLNETIQSIHTAVPESLVLVVSVGKVGECDTLATLIQACHG